MGIIIPICYILADLFLSFVWALAPELLFEIYQSVERISFAGETRSVSVAVCRPSIDSHTHTRTRNHHTHATTHTHTLARNVLWWLCVCGIHNYITEPTL